MSRTVKAIPDGYHSLTPYLIFRDADKAIEFYKRAFGAVETCRMNDPQTGKVMHAELKLGDSMLFLAEEFPAYGARSPQTLGGSPVTIHHYVEDADATMAQAVEAGATVAMPAMDMFWGDRFGKLTDPFGHDWSIATHIEDLTPEQMPSAWPTPAQKAELEAAPSRRTEVDGRRCPPGPGDRAGIRSREVGGRSPVQQVVPAFRILDYARSKAFYVEGSASGSIGSIASARTSPSSCRSAATGSPSTCPSTRAIARSAGSSTSMCRTWTTGTPSCWAKGCR